MYTGTDWSITGCVLKHRNVVVGNLLATKMTKEQDWDTLLHSMVVIVRETIPLSVLGKASPRQQDDEKGPIMGLLTLLKQLEQRYKCRSNGV